MLHYSTQKYAQGYHNIIMIMISPPDSAMCGSMSSSADDAPPSRHTIHAKDHKLQSKIDTAVIPFVANLLQCSGFNQINSKMSKNGAKMRSQIWDPPPLFPP